MRDADLKRYRKKINCRASELDEYFADYMQSCENCLSKKGIDEYLSGASLISETYCEWEVIEIYLGDMPAIAHRLGEPILNIVAKGLWDISRSPNSDMMQLFMRSFVEASEQLSTWQQAEEFLRIIFQMMDSTTMFVPDFKKLSYNQSFPALLRQAPSLLNHLTLEGFNNWVVYGCKNFKNHSQQQQDYFSLLSAESKTIQLRELDGSVFIDHQRKLQMYLFCMWNDKAGCLAIPLETLNNNHKPIPYVDQCGIHVPAAYSELNGVSGVDRYRMAIAHIAGHRRWSTPVREPHYKALERWAIACFEDIRIDYLILKQYPGIRSSLLALHTIPFINKAEPDIEECLLMISRAVLDKSYVYKHDIVLRFVQQCRDVFDKENSSTQDMCALALSFIDCFSQGIDEISTMQADKQPVTYRDDNRHLWIFDEDAAGGVSATETESEDEQQHVETGKTLTYDEWDYKSNTYKPDWVSLHETRYLKADGNVIDAILSKHKPLTQKLKQILEALRLKQSMRLRFQEEGHELDLDVAIQSMIDYQCGISPDPRINMSHINKNASRDIAVMILLDLSASLNSVTKTSGQSLLQLSQEAVSLLAYTIEQLGDQYAICAFNSDTRENVYFYHLKSYQEQFDQTTKSRLAAMCAGYSTRMGSAIRHAAHSLVEQAADKKLMLILTDGEPADIDVVDDEYLIQDTRKAIDEISSKGISSYCISLDRKADDYIQNIFGLHGYTIIDHVDKLPEKLPLIFTGLTT